MDNAQITFFNQSIQAGPNGVRYTFSGVPQGAFYAASVSPTGSAGGQINFNTFSVNGQPVVYVYTSGRTGPFDATLTLVAISSDANVEITLDHIEELAEPVM